MRALSIASAIACLAFGVATGGPALAASKKPMSHHASKAMPETTTDQLNAASLAAAQQGKPFSPTK